MRPEYAWGEGWKDELMKWLEQPHITVMKKGKKTEKEVDIRPLIYEVKFSGDKLVLGLGAGLDRNVRPELVMKAFADASGRSFQPFMFFINRDEVYADLGQDGAHRFTALIDLGKEII